MTRHFILLQLISLLAIGLYAQTTTLPLTEINLILDADERMDQFNEYQIVRLETAPLFRLWETPGDFIQFTLEHNEQPLHFQLSRLDLRAPGYTLTSGSRDDRTFKIHPRLPAAQFQGSLNGTEAPAIFTIDENFVLGHWQINGEKYYLEPLWRFADGVPQDAYILYNESGIDPYIGECGTHSFGQGHQHTHTEAPESIVDGGCIEVAIALASDFELYQDFNNSATQVENFLLNSLAAVQTNYDSQIGDEEFNDELRYVVTDTYIATSNESDPWTNSTVAVELLESFRDWGNAGGFNATYDVASIWTGRNFDGTTIGIAYSNGVICTSNRYNANENFSSNAARIRVLWAHELGHNFSASHDEGQPFTTIMAPSVNITDEWSQQSRDQINGYYPTASCLTSCPQSPPATSFTVSLNPACPGSPIAFMNQTQGSVFSFSWSFPGGIPATSNEINPEVVYNSPGNYTATLVATNAAGSSSSQEVIVIAQGNTSLLLFEDFEQDFGDVQVSNPDNSTTWALRNIQGNGSNAAAFLNNYNYNAQGQVDGLVLPPQDMLASTNLRLTFEYAYVRYNANLSDQLRVRVVSTSGFTQSYLFEEDGSGNFATSNDQTSFFTPTTASDWCFLDPGCIDLDLSAFNGQNSVQVFIENINGYGNNMYIDNLQLTATCAPSDPLPVEWLSFTADAEKDAASLNWSVKQDNAHAGFYVERAKANTSASWKTIGFVERRGQGEATANYSFKDYSIQAGAQYLYRLRQVDVDGSEDFSVIRSVAFDGKYKAVEIWPNPSQETLYLNTGIAQGNYQILDLNGRLLGSGSIASATTSIALNGLSSGVYWLRLIDTADGDTQSLKFIKR